MEKGSSNRPHVLIFPLPAQGHVNSMLKLAELLCLSGLFVTFLNSEHNHERLVRFTDLQVRFSKYQGFQFKTVPDGLPVEHQRTGNHFVELFETMKMVTMPIFKEMAKGMRPPLNCIIGDGTSEFVLESAIEIGIPVIHFRTVSACSYWSYFCIPDMIKAGELPIKGSEDMDRIVTTVPGMDTFLRCRDLPSFCRADDTSDLYLQQMTNCTRQTLRARGLILNTFEDLEGPILSQIRRRFSNVYSIGPLHEHLRKKLIEQKHQTHQSSNSLWEVDRSCMSWLDKQPSKSVLYVSFGSIAVTTKEQFLEFWHGLVDSKKRFLWVMRADSVAKIDGEAEDYPPELVEGTKERGFIVEWTPQEEVLAHEAVGGFLTHSGWNSTLESIVAGVPMICWPYFADQQINSRFVGEVWKLGLDMKDVCDRKVVEKMVNDLMEDNREEFVRSAAKMAELARNSVSKGGSSNHNLNCLIEDIRLMIGSITITDES
ncbi:hypothetical protein K2173_011091 [Erythroxylum novogranatense]|uniref:Glycosyltransferase n=1 Tax=Erythroxylum novogranatense TaxID=1862640 RepID=A0AAV8T0E7_9ROSI|nr:hypothetical protein K2173_011091 [Erythroxylum novogranatense]